MPIPSFLTRKIKILAAGDYFACKSCNTQIALRQDSNFFLPGESLEDRGMVFHKLANVRIDEEPIHHHKLGPHTVADIHCIKCGDKLGYKYIKVCGVHVYHHVGSNYTLEDNMLNLLLDKLSCTRSPGLDYTAPPVRDNADE